jgi:nucleotide-binding universal stress UspA family protein
MEESVMFHNILVAVDGSPDADEALAQAIDLAESEHTRLTLMTAEAQIPATAYLTPAINPLIADTHAEAQAVLRRARDRVPEDLPVTTILTDQPIRTALIHQIQAGHHDLVAMGSRGRGAVRSALLGSFSHYVLNHSPVPVLIVHADHGRPVASLETAAAA